MDTGIPDPGFYFQGRAASIGFPEPALETAAVRRSMSVIARLRQLRRLSRGSGKILGY